jgi:hypothetical protein
VHAIAAGVGALAASVVWVGLLRRKRRRPTNALPKHAVLRRRAAAAHQSLQEYLRARLIAEAASPTVEDVLDRAGGQAGGSVAFDVATRALREDRDRR